MLAISRKYGLSPAVSSASRNVRLVHARAAGGDDDAVEAVLLDVLDDHLLARVGAHVLVGAGDGDAGQCADATRTTASQSTTLAMFVPQLQT